MQELLEVRQANTQLLCLGSDIDPFQGLDIDQYKRNIERDTGTTF